MEISIPTVSTSKQTYPGANTRGQCPFRLVDHRATKIRK